MKFDFCIGNPPYQEDTNNDRDRKSPVYHYFMDEAYKVANTVELITPARFLFNAGQTPKDWNKKMLADKHLKVSWYEQDSSKVFSNTDIKGGVAITYRDSSIEYGPIDIFVSYPELRSIISKVKISYEESISTIVTGAVPYHFTEKLRREQPQIANTISVSFDLRSNILDKYKNSLFFETCPTKDDEYIMIFGLQDRTRCYRYIKKDYVSVPSNFCKWKVILPESNGNGTLGEVLTSPFVEKPNVGHTQTFISIGSFDTKEEANALLKYLKGKFARVLFGVLKITQHNPVATWAKIPLQDFTENSDIDWSQSIKDIDKQLYKKYGLDDEEIEFIESNVKEMK